MKDAWYTTLAWDELCKFHVAAFEGPPALALCLPPPPPGGWCEPFLTLHRSQYLTIPEKTVASQVSA